MATALEVKTFFDYSNLPEESLAQLIDGEIIMSPAPIPYHQKILRNIFRKIDSIVLEDNLGEVFLSPIDVYFSDTEVYQPDLIFIAKERSSIIGPKYIEAAPDLVLEVLSESNAYFDLRHKKDIYEKFGVQEYWIVDPMAFTIEVFVLNEQAKYELPDGLQKSGQAISCLLPKLKVELEVLFAT